MSDEVSVSRVMADDDEDRSSSPSRTSSLKRGLVRRNRRPKPLSRDTCGDASPQDWGLPSEGDTNDETVLADAADGGVGTVTSFIGTVTGQVNRVSKTFVNIVSNHRRVSVAAALLLAFVGGGAYVMHDDSSDAAIFWVDDEEDECYDAIAEVTDDIGEGEVKIPSSIIGSDGKTYKVGFVASWEGRVGPLRGLGLTGDVLKMANFYDANGGHTDAAGFERIGDFYIVALGQGPFRAKGANALHVGDLCTITFDDGTTIKTIVGDTKGRYGVSDPYDPSTWNRIIAGTDPQGRTDKTCGWGHIAGDDVGVLEFWGYGGSVMEALRSSTGGSMTRCTSLTDHGMSSEFADFAGYGNSVVGGATESMRNIRATSSHDAADECKAKLDYDNSTLVSAMLSYAYSRRVTYGEGYPGTRLYENVCETVLGADVTASYGYRSCDRGVAAAIIWSGADVNVSRGACEDQWKYFYEHGELYDVICDNNFQPGSGAGAAEAAGLEPGDILVSRGEHTMMYVGHDAIEQAYASFGAQGTDDRNVGEPDSGAIWAMASNAGTSGAGRAVCMQATSDTRTYAVFRYKGDFPDADRYADVGATVMLDGQKSKNTSCDCQEDDQDCGEKIAELAASLALSAVNDGVDYNQMLKDLGIYGTAPGQYTYSSTGNIINHFHVGETAGVAGGDWGNSRGGSVTGEIPDERIPGASAYIAFTLNDKSAPGYGWFANCAAMPPHLYYEFDFPWKELSAVLQPQRAVAYGGEGVDYRTPFSTEHYNFIPADPTKTWDEQCKPGDYLANGKQPHYFIYIGNEIARKYFPGTTGNTCEAGARSWSFWGIRERTDCPSEDWLIVRPKCPDDDNDAVSRLNSSNADRLIYIQWGSRPQACWPIPGGAMSPKNECGTIALMHSIILLTGDYTLTPDSILADMERKYGTIAADDTWSYTLRYAEEQYGIHHRNLRHISAEQAKGILAQGHVISVGGGCEDREGVPFGKAAGVAPRCCHGHVVLFYRYDDGMFYVKDSAPGDGAAMCLYPEGPLTVTHHGAQGGRCSRNGQTVHYDNYADAFLRNGFSTELWKD